MEIYSGFELSFDSDDYCAIDNAIEQIAESDYDVEFDGDVVVFNDTTDFNDEKEIFEFFKPFANEYKSLPFTCTGAMTSEEKRKDINIEYDGKKISCTSSIWYYSIDYYGTESFDDFCQEYKEITSKSNITREDYARAVDEGVCLCFSCDDYTVIWGDPDPIPTDKSMECSIDD